jgi:hypothetical protein
MAPGSAARVALTEVSWHARRELAASDWLRQGRWLGALGRASGWWIGDWVRYGNARYGERYALAARITGYDPHSLMNMAYVASHFEMSRRREKLSFSHHAELAALPHEVQERWLDRAEREHLSVRRLRTALRCELRPVRALERPRDNGAAPAEIVCPHCGHRFPR